MNYMSNTENGMDDAVILSKTKGPDPTKGQSVYTTSKT